MMIPLFAVVRIQAQYFPRFRLWLPLFLIWLLLMPLVLILFPFFCVVCIWAEINPFHAVGVLWGILAGLKGVYVEVTDASHHILINIR